MIKQVDAKCEIISRFRQWARDIEKPTGHNVLKFYGELETQNDSVLNFSAAGDKYQVIIAWLMREKLIDE